MKQKFIKTIYIFIGRVIFLANLATSQTPTPLSKAKTTRRIWIDLLRPHTLTASFIPVLIGTMLSVVFLDTIQISYGLFFAFLLLCMCLQTATNIYNEYFDYVKGLDTAESVGNGGTIVRYGVSPKTVRNIGHFCMTASLLLGLYICSQTSWILLILGLFSMGIAYLYTGGPKPIAYTPFGEIFSGFFMGILIINIAFFIQTGNVIWETLVASLPSFILIGLILTGNSIRDIKEDTRGGRKTLAILLGKERSVLFLKVMFTLTFLITAGFALTQTVPWIYLLTLLAVPKAIQACNGFLGKEQPADMMPGMIAIAQTYTLYGLLFSLCLLLSYFLH